MRNEQSKLRGINPQKFNLTISNSTTRLIQPGDPLRTIEGQEIRLPLDQLFAPETNIANLEEWGQTRWISVDTCTTENGRNKILIPVSEIVRFYYLNHAGSGEGCGEVSCDNKLIRRCTEFGTRDQ